MGVFHITGNMAAEDNTVDSYESKSSTSTTKILVTPEVIAPIQAALASVETPLPERLRAVFTLKNLGGPLAIKALATAFTDESVLLKHEVAYAIGQMREPAAIEILKGLLSDSNEHPVVRHEAGEALGAIGTDECYAIVQQFVNDPSREVRETCELAVARIQWLQTITDPKKREKFAGESDFYTVDPAPASEVQDIDELTAILIDEDKPIFERYSALFALRDLNSDESVAALMRGFESDSALLRHEIAYVLGQMQKSSSFAGLEKVLANSDEHPMVRHEAAEAIGALPDDHVNHLLSGYLKDQEALVSESCLVALDMADYFQSDQFEYADSLNKV